MEQFDELAKRLGAAQDGYQKAIEAIDAKLNHIVSADPKQLGKAKLLQNQFVFTPVVRQLAARMQPAPRLAKKAAKRSAKTAKKK